MGAESPLVDGTAQWFCTIVKTCVLPCKSAALAADTLEVLVCAPKDDKGSTVLLRLLTLLVRSGMARGAVFDAWYDVLLQHMKQPTTAPDAMRLLHAITRKRRVRAYRAQKLKRWYEASRDANEKQQTGALWLLLQLYGRYDQRNCGRYCPAQKVAMSVSRLFQCEFRLGAVLARHWLLLTCPAVQFRTRNGRWSFDTGSKSWYRSNRTERLVELTQSVGRTTLSRRG